MEPEVTPTVLQTISSLVTSAFGWLGTAFTTAGTHTEMYIPLGIGIVGAAVGMFRRAIKIGGRRR